MMIADAGYRLILTLAGFCYIGSNLSKAKENAFIIGSGSISTIIWVFCSAVGSTKRFPKAFSCAG